MRLLLRNLYNIICKYNYKNTQVKILLDEIDALILHVNTQDIQTDKPEQTVKPRSNEQSVLGLHFLPLFVWV